VCVCVYACLCICVCLRACVTHTYTQTHTRTHTRTHTHTHRPTQGCANRECRRHRDICSGSSRSVTHTHTYTYTYKHTCTCTHTHIHSGMLRWGAQRIFGHMLRQLALSITHSHSIHSQTHTHMHAHAHTHRDAPTGGAEDIGTYAQASGAQAACQSYFASGMSCGCMCVLGGVCAIISLALSLLCLCLSRSFPLILSLSLSLSLFHMFRQLALLSILSCFGVVLCVCV